MSVDQLQSTFTAMIDRHPNLPALAPAFFIEEMLSTVAVEGHPAVEEPSPFDDFWMIYTSDNKPIGTITNIALCRDREVRLWVILHGVSERLTHSITFNLDDPTIHELHNTNANGRAVRETIPEMRIILDRINNNVRVQSTHPALNRLNANRTKKQMKKIAPYIVITPDRIAPQPSVATGTGTPMPPHERRGHFRTYKKTGMKVWVRDCSIHGGSKAARDYLVT